MSENQTPPGRATRVTVDRLLIARVTGKAMKRTNYDQVEELHDIAEDQWIYQVPRKHAAPMG